MKWSDIIHVFFISKKASRRTWHSRHDNFTKEIVSNTCRKSVVAAYRFRPLPYDTSSHMTYMIWVCLKIIWNNSINSVLSKFFCFLQIARFDMDNYLKYFSQNSQQYEKAYISRGITQFSISIFNWQVVKNMLKSKEHKFIISSIFFIVYVWFLSPQINVINPPRWWIGSHVLVVVVSFFFRILHIFAQKPFFTSVAVVFDPNFSHQFNAYTDDDSCQRMFSPSLSHKYILVLRSHCDWNCL